MKLETTNKEDLTDEVLLKRFLIISKLRLVEDIFALVLTMF